MLKLRTGDILSQLLSIPVLSIRYNVPAPCELAVE